MCVCAHVCEYECVCFHWHSCARAVCSLCPQFSLPTAVTLRACHVWCWLAGPAGVRNITGMNLELLLTDTLSYQNGPVLKCFFFFFCPQPGSRRPVNGTDEKFGSKEPKPSTLEPVSCISMYLYICLYWRLALPWTLMRRVSLKYRDGFTSSINLESDSSSLWAPWKFRMVHWDFARSHFSFKVHSIPLAHNFT